MYHIRWSVESGIKDLIENYFLNYPPGDSPEKVEVHYYCVMLARLVIDYFSSIFCELTQDETDDLKLTYLDGDTHGIKQRLKSMLEQRKIIALNRVSRWGDRGIKVEIKDQFNFS